MWELQLAPCCLEPSPLCGTPLYVPPQRVGFLHRFGQKTAIDSVHFGMESGMVLTNKRVTKKEKSTD